WRVSRTESGKDRYKATPENHSSFWRTDICSTSARHNRATRPVLFSTAWRTNHGWRTSASGNDRALRPRRSRPLYVLGQGRTNYWLEQERRHGSNARWFCACESTFNATGGTNYQAI